MRQTAHLSKVKSHEEIVVENYDWLVGWARRLSEGLREEANDLVHDLFVQLIRSRPNLETHDDDAVRAYLYTMLRNLAVSRARRRGHDPLSSLSIVDYDSVSCGLAAVDRTQLIFVRSDLSRVCEYANRRKHTFRAASILILRFFLSYYPSEIVRMLGTTRVAIEKSLQAARLEANAFIRRPQSLRILGHDIPLPPLFPSSLPDQPEALFAELQHRVLSGKCDDLSRPDATCQRYNGEWMPLETEELAHVVGCPRCLDAINYTLGIPMLSERLRSEPTDRDPGGSGPPSATDIRTSASARRKLANTYEHGPRKLQIAVDGEIRASQKVSRTRNELEIQLDPFARPSFLEVFSEQKVRLLYLQLDETVQPYLTEQRASAALSDGRSIELHLRFPGGTAVVTALYNDGQLEEISNESKLVRPERNSPGFHVSALRWLSRLKAFSRPFSQRLASFGSLGTMRRRIWVGLALAGLGFFVLGYFALRHRGPGTAIPTAREVLFRSGNYESLQIKQGGAVHSRYKLETLSSAGNVLETSTVERWTSLKPTRSSLRLTTQRGKLLAGRWQDPEGHLATYTRQHGLKKKQEPAPDLPDFQNAWDFAPGTAASMSAWKDLEDSATLHQSANTYEIAYQQPAPHPVAGIVSATLVINAAAMRPVREDLVVAEHGETKEYRFEELTYDIVPASQLEDSDFTPPSELASLRFGFTPPLNTSGGNAHLMLAALELLDQLDPQLVDGLDLSRLPDGSVRLSGVLPTSEQKRSVERAFASLPADGDLQLALHSADEPPRPGSSARNIQVESTAAVPVLEGRIPFDHEIRSALVAQQVPESEIDGRVQQIASRTVNEAANVHREAWLVRQIAAEDFSLHDLQQLQPSDQQRWLIVLRTHTRLLTQSLSTLSQDLSFIPPGSTPSLPKTSPVTNSAALAQVALDLSRNCESLDRQVTAGLTLAPAGTSTAPSEIELGKLLDVVKQQEITLSATIERLAVPR